MVSGIRWGVMAATDDIDLVRSLDVDFIELLVKDGDDLGRIEEVLRVKDREMIVHAPERMRLDGEVRLLDLADRSPLKRKRFARRFSAGEELPGVAVRPGRGMADTKAPRQWYHSRPRPPASTNASL
jgi:hypothetical protein